MTYFWRLLYLFGKYVFITNLLDPGYSRSRDPYDRKRNQAMFWHVFVQLITTVVLLFSWDRLDTLAAIIAIEGVLLMFSTLIERRAKLLYALRTYLAVEIAMLVGYAVIVYLTSV